MANATDNNNTDSNSREQDLSNERIDELIHQFEQLGKDFKEIEAWVDPHIYRRLEKLAGPYLETMLKSQEETIKYLTEPNANVREAALQLAYRHWNITDMLAAVYESMALTDPDDRVRETAIRALGTCFSQTKDPRIGHLLAGFVRNDALADSMRVTAFTSLLRLHGNMAYGDEGGKSPLVPTSLEDIDWIFVDRYLHAEQ
jgi:hypothetical protein